MTAHARSIDSMSGTLMAALGWLAALAAVATLVIAPPSANAEEGAPIVYGKTTQRGQMSGQVERAEFAGLQNTTTPAIMASLRTPAAETLAPLADVSRDPAPRTQNNANAFASAGAIDLRPGAPRIESASFGPAPAAAPPVSPASPMVQDAARSLQTRPAPAIEYAQPVAGAPYQVEGRWYVPMHEPNYDEVGVASWYGPTFHGKAAANGEIFDEMAMTAAHPTLPLPSLVRVTNLENGKSAVVRLNDRGPFVDDRIIDLSKGAAHALDMHRKGTAKVRVEYVGPAPKQHNVVPSQPMQVQFTARADEAAVIEARPLTSTPTAMAPVTSAPDKRLAEPRLPVADPVEARPQPARVQQAAVAGEGAFMLQAGSFADLGNAHQLRDRLASVGPVAITPVRVDGSEFYRVMVGPWPTRAAATEAQSRAAQAGTKAIIVSR